jgi:hypothetical protein
MVTPEIESRMVLADLISDFVTPLLPVVAPFLPVLDAIRPISPPIHPIRGAVRAVSGTIRKVGLTISAHAATGPLATGPLATGAGGQSGSLWEVAAAAILQKLSSSATRCATCYRSPKSRSSTAGHRGGPAA